MVRFGKRKWTDNLLDIVDVDQEIYRILRFEYLIDMVKTNELTLANPSKWPDPFENFFLRSVAVEQNGEKVSLHELARKWYGICWTYDRDNDAMWNRYSIEKTGVRISTTVRKLFEHLWDDADSYVGLRYFCGKVNYVDQREIESFLRYASFSEVAAGAQNDNFAKLLCVKRLGFQHEHEVRLLMNDVGEDSEMGDLYRLKLPINNVINEICFDPRLDERTFQDRKAEIERMGCTLPITQSEFYKQPSIELKM